MTWALKLEDKNLKKNLELKIYTGKKPRCMSALAHILWWYSLGLDPLLTLIEFGDLLAKTSKMQKLTFLLNKYTKLKLRHYTKWYLTPKVWFQSYMMLLISLNFTVFIIFVDLLTKYISIYAWLPKQNELKIA